MRILRLFTQSQILFFFSFFIILLLSGCANRPINTPITQADPQEGYRPYLLLPKRQNNDQETLFVLSFSGGGKRAAAFSYGLLEELRKTEIQVNGQQRSLRDEVDLIMGVSGGSFTALSYALYGEQLFSEYEERFLKRDVQGKLLSRSLNPLNWPKYIGVSDNIGVRGVLEALEELRMSAEFRGETGFGVARMVILMVVNAHSSPNTKWDQNEEPPGFFPQLMQSTGGPIDRYSFKTVETMKDRAAIMQWRRDLQVAKLQLAGASKLEAERSVDKLDFKVVDISFDSIREPLEREYFMNLPTSFVLSADDIDRLREMAGTLFCQTNNYQQIIDSF